MGQEDWPALPAHESGKMERYQGLKQKVKNTMDCNLQW